MDRLDLEITLARVLFHGSILLFVLLFYISGVYNYILLFTALLGTAGITHYNHTKMKQQKKEEKNND